MPFEGAGAAELDHRFIPDAWFGYLDFLGDPLRATTWKANVDFVGTGDEDLDGERFNAIGHEFVRIGPILQGESGSGPLEITLSGLILADNDLLNLLGTEANWKGRTARIWCGVYNQAMDALVAVAPFKTGYMTGCKLPASKSEQFVTITVETYLAAFSHASHRTYMNQAEYDPGDLSASAAITLANGVTSNPLLSNTPIVQGGGSGGRGKGIDPVNVGKL